MKKTAFISDILFTFLVAFLLSTVFFRFLSLAFVPALVLGALCGTLSALGVGAYLLHRRKRYFLKRSDEALKNKLLTHLALLSNERKTRFFQALFAEENARYTKLKIYTEKAVYFLPFHFSPVLEDEVASFARLRTSKQKILLCGEIEERALALCMRLQIQVLTGEEVYRLVRSKNALPAEFLGEETPVNKHKRQFRLCFSKANSKRFLVSGALIILASLFTPFPLYYWLFGGLLLTVSAVIRIFGYSVL